MQILIDADGCPVVDATIQIARRFHVPCTLVCDTSHQFQREGVGSITVSKGADSVDYAIVNRLKKGDIVVTQDYGLAAMVLARGGYPITQNGLLISDQNIDSLLEQRYIAKKIRRGGGRLRGPAKRTPEQDAAFAAQLTGLLEQIIS